MLVEIIWWNNKEWYDKIKGINYIVSWVFLSGEWGMEEEEGVLWDYCIKSYG